MSEPANLHAAAAHPAAWRELPDEEATLQFAAALARALPTDEEPLVLYLHGDLGAGKTTLARGVLHAMGEQGAVRSPTYALVAEYQPRGQRVLHLDLYRLADPEELIALGLGDYLPGSRLWLVEWPDRGAHGGLPQADAHVFLEPSGAGRRVLIVGATERGRQWGETVLTDSGS